MATRAGETLLAGKGDKQLVAAVGAAHSGEALGQVAAAEECRDGPLDDRSPETVLGREPLRVDLPKGVEVPLHQPPELGGPRIARAVQGPRFDAGGDHGLKASRPGVQPPSVCTHVHFRSSRGCGSRWQPGRPTFDKALLLAAGAALDLQTPAGRAFAAERHQHGTRAGQVDQLHDALRHHRAGRRAGRPPAAAPRAPGRDRRVLRSGLL